MAYTPTQCPKCNGQMAQGFIKELAYRQLRGASSWLPGPPRWSFWYGALGRGKSVPIGAFRCESCGYLECYARAEFSAK
jgi:hypothetical protein